MMNLVDGLARFGSRSANYVCYPCGTPTQQIIGVGGHQTTIQDARPIVEFANGAYATRDEEIAKGLVNTEMFGTARLFLSPESVSEELRSIYINLGFKAKQTLVLALIEGKTTEEAYSAVPKQEIQAAKAAGVHTVPGEYRAYCPVKGCTVSIGGLDVKPEDAKKMIGLHIRSMHPDWKGETAPVEKKVPIKPAISPAPATAGRPVVMDGVRSVASAMGKTDAETKE